MAWTIMPEVLTCSPEVWVVVVAATGGCLIGGEYAFRWGTLADAEGNEVDGTTWMSHGGARRTQSSLPRRTGCIRWDGLSVRDTGCSPGKELR
ncbi:MAG: hypothetical protein ACRDRL_28925 [Sciscionella sp.]